MGISPIVIDGSIFIYQLAVIKSCTIKIVVIFIGTLLQDAAWILAIWDIGVALDILNVRDLEIVVQIPEVISATLGNGGQAAATDEKWSLPSEQ